MGNRLSMAAAASTCLLVVALPASAERPEWSEWSAPVNLGPAVNSAFNDFGPAISKDGLSLYFGSNRPTEPGDLVLDANIWLLQRASDDSPWGPPVLVPAINTPEFIDNVPALSRDGHWLFFTSNRPGGSGDTDVWVSFRAHTHDDFGWDTPVNLGPQVNSAFNEGGGSFLETDDGGLFFFGSSRPGGLGANDIYATDRLADGSFGPARLIVELSSPQDDQRPGVRFDGRELFLLSNRSGTLGQTDIWVSTRDSVDGTWSQPLNLGAPVNGTAFEQHPYISSDRETLFFASTRAGGSGGPDLYVSTRTRN